MADTVLTHEAYYALLTRAASSPADYKVCLVCGNIAEYDVDECPHCCGYRFESNIDCVANRAIDQAAHPQTAVTDPFAYAYD